MPIATPQGTLDFKSVDKVTFVGASSNTVIDTTTGSLGVGVGVGGPTSNLHVVGHTRLEGDINMLHTSNNAAIKLNSNVVTEFPRSKKLIKYPRVALTQNALNNGYTVIQSGTNGQDHRKAWTLFNNDVTTDDQYHAIPQSGESNPYNPSTGAYEPDAGFEDGLGDVAGEYVYVVMPDKIKLQGVSVHPRDGVLNRSAESARFMGSNDNGTTWVDLGGYTDYVWASGSQEPGNFFTADSNEYYDYIGVVWTKVKGGSGGDTVNMAEVQFFGVPEYDPDAAGVDVKVTSYPNVPNTDWLEVYYDAKGLTDISSGVSDLSGNSINGVVTGASLGTDENIDIFNFDGQNDIIQGTFSGHTLSSGYTMATWIKPGDIGADDYIATFGVGSNGTSFGINFQTVEGAFRAFIWGSSTPGIVAQTNNDVVTKDKWVHVAATFLSEDGTIHLYIDNKLVATGTGTTLSSISSSAPLVLGARNNGGTIERHANFKMANFRLFNRALTPDEIYQLYAYQKEYFGRGDLSLTLKAGRLGIGTSEPRAALDVRGDIYGGCPVYFSVRCTSNAGAGIIPWNDVLTSRGGGFNASNGIFTVPLSGVYSFAYAIRERDSNANIYTNIQINGVDDLTVRTYHRSNYSMGSITFIRRMTKGDTIAIELNSGDMASSYNQFTGQYISSV